MEWTTKQHHEKQYRISVGVTQSKNFCLSIYIIVHVQLISYYTFSKFVNLNSYNHISQDLKTNGRWMFCVLVTIYVVSWESSECKFATLQENCILAVTTIGHNHALWMLNLPCMHDLANTLEICEPIAKWKPWQHAGASDQISFFS